MEKATPIVGDGKRKIANGFVKKATPTTTINNNSTTTKNLNKKPAEKKKDKKEKSNTTTKNTKPAGSSPKKTSFALPQGCTPLMYACQQADHKQVIDILKKDPGSVHKRDRTLKTALHYCFDNPTAVTADRILMASPSLLESRDQDGFTPLHLAVIQGNMSLVTFLLANNSDVMALDNEKHSVIHWATVCGELEALRAVLSAGADASTADVHGGYPLHYAAQMCGARGTSGGGGTRLALDVLAALLRAPATRVDVKDIDGRQPLLWAASAGSAPAVLALVKAGAEVEAADKDGLTALHCAASRGHTECIETLLTLCGARTDVIDSNGCTALHYAVTLGHADATALLLQHGADPNRQDRRGRSPAHCGCAKGQIETVKMLGAHNANLWLRNAKGDLPLHEAVASGRRELVKWLLEMRPSQINATNNEGRTLLHIAANTDNTDLCKILLDFGAQVNAVYRTSKNILMTPLDCALHRGYRSTAKYLQLHGGLPASRLTSRQVVVDQETVPQLPIRHIKSTKINLKNRVNIERREIIEMSPSNTSRRRFASKVEISSDSYSDYSSDEYERQILKIREERQKQKKRAKREQLKGKKHSLSDGYDSDQRRHLLSKDKSLSDSESSGHAKAKRSKRSKSEPTSRDRDRDESRSKERSSSKQHRHRKSDDSETDSEKHKKKRKRTSSKRSRSSSASSVEKNVKHEEKIETKRGKELITESIGDEKHKDDIEMLKQAAEVAKAINIIESESSQRVLEKIFEKHIQNDSDNTFTVMESTVVTEAQIHAENQSSLDKVSLSNVIAEESGVIPGEFGRKDQEVDDFYEQKFTNVQEDKGVNITQTSMPDTNETIQPDDADNKEHSTEKLTKDGILAIIPDSDSIDTHTEKILSVEETQSHEEETETASKRPLIQVESTSVDTDEKSESGHAIMGILEDEENDVGTSELDNAMGEAILTEVTTTEDGREVSLNEEVVSQVNENKSFITLPSEQENELLQQDSEEAAEGISEMAVKAVGDINKTDTSETESVRDTTGILKNKKTDKGIQKILPDVKAPSRVHSSRRSQSHLQKNKPRDSATNRSQLYETQSYKVLTDSTLIEDYMDEQDDKRIMKEHVEEVMRVSGNVELDEPDRFVKHASYTRRRASSVSDNEMYSVIDSNGTIRRRRLKKKYRDTDADGSVRSKSQNSERDYDSSGIIDSGIEPSPKFQHRIMSPRLAAYYRERNASGLFSGSTDTRIPKRKPGDSRAVDMASVTQIVQTNMRRYFLERKIFQHLMDLKRLQIRVGKANEAMLVKRAVEEYHRSSLAYVGAGRYTGADFTFKKFEKFLYDSLRRLQRSGVRHLANLPEKAFPDYIVKGDNQYSMDGLPDNPILCTSKTHRCYHTVHAYTGIPCSAYIPMKMNHHSMPKPVTPGHKRGFSFLPQIHHKGKQTPNSQVTLELCHGNEKQKIALPAEKLDKNKRYYVTFTVKGASPDSDNVKNTENDTNIQRNVKSV